MATAGTNITALAKPSVGTTVGPTVEPTAGFARAVIFVPAVAIDKLLKEK